MPKNYVLSENEIYNVQKRPTTKQTEVKFYTKYDRSAYVFWHGTAAGAEILPVRYDVRVTTAQGQVRGSLVESVAQVIGDELIAYRFMDAFLLDYDLPKLLRKNAPFALTYEKLYENGQFIRNGEVLKAELEIRQDKVVRNFMRLKNGGLFVNPNDDYSSRPFYAPVDYVKFSSLFQPRRFHPIQKFRRSHQGIDFEAQEGTSVLAASTGRVLRVGRNRAAGNFVVMTHGNGYETYYNHMKTAARLTPNQVVPAGTPIGQVGCTGYCTKPHLHFAVKKHGSFINPIRFIRNYSYGQRSEMTSIWSRAGL